MLGSETLEVAIGLSVLFTFMSLFATAFRETIEAYAKQRAALVHKGLAQIFSATGDESSPTLRQFYETIVISPLFKGAYDGLKGHLPSYITSGDFAAGLIEVARKDAGAADGTPLADWIGKIKDVRVAQMVRLAYSEGRGDPDKTRAYLERWFDGQMERVSGWYKRGTHVILIVIGFVSAAVLNVDAIAVTKHLYRNDAMRELIVAHAQARPPGEPKASGGPDAPLAPSDGASAPSGKQGAAETDAPSAPDATSNGAANAAEPNGPAANAADANNVDADTVEANKAAESGTGASAPSTSGGTPDEVAGELRSYGFPMGWSWEGKWPTPIPQCALRAEVTQSCALDTLGWPAILLMLVGWAVIAFGISLGAPFWFDVLNKVMVIRSTVKPFEKSPPEGSADRQPQAPAPATPPTS